MFSSWNNDSFRLKIIYYHVSQISCLEFNQSVKQSPINSAYLEVKTNACKLARSSQ